jgi:hypothetical protein
VTAEQEEVPTTAEDDRGGTTTEVKVDPVAEEDEAPLHEPNPFWQILAAQYALVLPQ